MTNRIYRVGDVIAWDLVEDGMRRLACEDGSFGGLAEGPDEPEDAERVCADCGEPTAPDDP